MDGASVFDYSSIRLTAQTLIATFGRNDCFFLRLAEGTAPDPSMPWIVNPGTVSSYNFIGAVIPLKMPIRSDPEIDQTDKDCYMPGNLKDSSSNLIVPTLIDRIQVGRNGDAVKAIYSILGVTEFNPNNIAIAYLLRLRAWPTLIKQPSTPY